MQRRTNDPMTGEPWERLHRAPLPEPRREGDLLVWAGVPYRSLYGYRPIELDLYVPVDSTDRIPIVVWIHGGAFALGSRRLLPDFLQRLDFFRWLAAQGFAVAAIDYRLSAEATWPAQIDDVRSAIRWLQARSAEFGGDPDRLVAWGESAGGHLAALAGVHGGALLPHEDPHSELARVAAVVDWYGPTNFARMDAQAPAGGMVHDTPDSPESRLLGIALPHAGSLIDDADPTAHVTEDAPPFFIRHGTDDLLVPFGQSLLLVDALEAAGIEVDFMAVKDAGHVFEGHPEPHRFAYDAVDFLSRHLTSGPEGGAALPFDTEREAVA